MSFPNLKQALSRVSMLFGIMMLFNACDIQSLLQIGEPDPSQNSNTLVINLGTDLSVRAIDQMTDHRVESYSLQGVGPGGSEFSVEDHTMNVYSRSGLEAGNWRISVQAKNSDGLVIARNDGLPVTISGTETKMISIICRVESGLANFGLDLSWPWWMVDRAEVHASLRGLSGEHHRLLANILGSSATIYNDQSLPNGKYRLDLTLRDRSFGNSLIWSTSEDVFLYFDDALSTPRKLDSGEMSIPGGVRNFAGSGLAGSNDSQGFEATFFRPSRIEYGPDDSIYVCDTHNHKIRRIDSDGNVTTVAGSTLGNAYGAGNVAKFNYPLGIAVDPDGNVYVADTSNDVIKKIGTDGNVVQWGANFVFTDPRDLTVDRLGNVFVVDGNRIIKIGIYGIAELFAGSSDPGDVDGARLISRFNLPSAIDVYRFPSGDEFIYVLDSGNGKVRKITAQTTVSSITQCSGRQDLSIASDGTMFIVDRNSNRIEIASADNGFGDVAAVFAGCGASGTVNGPYLSALLNDPVSVTADEDGNILVAEFNGSRIRKITR